MSADVQKIEYAALQHDISKLNQERYKDDVAIQELTRQVKEMNERIEDIMLVIDDMLKDNFTYKEAETLYQFA